MPPSARPARPAVEALFPRVVAKGIESLKAIAMSDTNCEIYSALYRDANGRQRPAIVKRLPPELARKPATWKQFQDEALLMSTLTRVLPRPEWGNGHIARRLDLEAPVNQAFFVLEAVDGWSLGRILADLNSRGRTMPVALACYIVRELCNILHRVHGAKDVSGEPLRIVHNGLRPAEVLVSFNGDVRLIDFGEAQSLGRASTVGSPSPEMIPVDKLRYWSPERAAGRQPDQRSDVWACGAILFEALAGRPAIAGQSVDGVLSFLRHGRTWLLESVEDQVAHFAQASNLASRLAAQLMTIVRKALATNPAARYPSVFALESDLALFALANDAFLDRVHVGEWLANLRTGR